MNWYILCTKLFHEKKVAEKLTNKGFEVYLPTQRIKKRWSDRIKVVDQLVISRIVFVHCNEEERNNTFVETGCYYMMDRSTQKVAIIPDKQLESFRALISQKELPVEFTDRQLKPGTKVRINNNLFDDIEAEITITEGKERVFVRLNSLGCAIVEVSQSDLTLIND